MKNRAFTYIEVLLSVAILGLILIPLLSQFYTGMQGNVTAELVTKSVNLASELMEEIISKTFDENAFPAEPVDPSAIGIDSGENPNARNTFDDVDDYNNWVKSPPEDAAGTALNEFSDFTRSVVVEYVDTVGSNWNTSSVKTNYKRIKVIVSHPKITERVLESIVSYYE